MRAAVLYENGPPAVLRYEEVPDPECPAGCVIVDAEAIGERFEVQVGPAHR